MIDINRFEQFQEFWSNLIEGLTKEEIFDLLTDIFFTCEFFIPYACCFGTVFIILMTLFECFCNFSMNGLDIIGRLRLRKKFKEKFTKDLPYQVHPMFWNLDKDCFGVYPDQSDHVEFRSDVICKNEENARLICLILNDDNLGKKFDIKSYKK